MEFNVTKDLRFISEFLSLSFERLSKEINIPKETLSRICNGTFNPSNEMLERIYGYIFENGIHYNEMKVEAYKHNHNVVLFHGSKNGIIGDISLEYSREDVDFGVGFYTGDNYNQSLDFICQAKHGSIYVLDVEYSDLKILNLDVSLDWMLLIALNRGLLEEYKNTKKYSELKNIMNQYDVIIAPIADNRMFTTIEDFISSGVNSAQAMNALQELSLGKQIVFKTEKAIKNIKILEQLYLTNAEKRAAVSKRLNRIKETVDYVSSAYRKHIREGLYIDEVFGNERNGL